MIIDCEKCARELLEKIKIETASFKRKPSLAMIRVGREKASAKYVLKKEKACEFVNFHSIVKRFPASIHQKDLLKEIEKLNKDENIDGILLQQPLPPHLDPLFFNQAIIPQKDVDGLHPLNLGKLLLNDLSGFIPCTPKGILTIFKRFKIPLEGKNVVILGRSNLVGKPLAMLLMQKSKSANATVTVLHQKSKNIVSHTKRADILIVAIGSTKYVKKEMVKKGVVIIDVGINPIGKKIEGDVDFINVQKIASKITKVPGGVGPMTVASLIENTLISYKRRNGF